MYPYIDLKQRNSKFIPEIHDLLDGVINNSDYILGKSVSTFESSFASFLGKSFCIGVGNGTDALVLCLKRLGIGPGDEVITTPKTYLASASAILLCGAKPVFADIGPDYNLDLRSTELNITPRTKAIILVHLAGNPAKEYEFSMLCKKYSIDLISDCAQAVGSNIGGDHVGCFSRFSTFSFHPLKNLACLGDGGAICTDNKDDADWFFMARNHGHISREESLFSSVNSRLDSFQAAVLSLKLLTLKDTAERRNLLANRYIERLGGVGSFQAVNPGCFHSYHILFFEVNSKSAFIAECLKRGVEVKDHYQLLVPEMRAFDSVRGSHLSESIPFATAINKRTISLPIGEYLTAEDVDIIANIIKSISAC